MQTPSTNASTATPMTPDEARAWLAAWRRAAPVIAKERRERSRSVPLCESIAALDDVFEAALASGYARATSGLVEQQRLFARLRMREPA